eukprot:Gb_03531 [translate_table: standard]
MVSAKGDIYSYGILLLEMLTRRQPTDEMFSGGLNLQKRVSMAFPERMEEVVDECFWTNVNASTKTRNERGGGSVGKYQRSICWKHMDFKIYTITKCSKER